MNVITMGAHILDVLVRPVTDIPPGQETVKPDVPTSMSVLPIGPNGERPSLHQLGANVAYTLDVVRATSPTR